MIQKSKSVSPMSNEGRNAYVIEHINEALLGLLKEKSLNEISISEICETAGVGRMSFYRNYESKEDVIKKQLLQLIQEWEKDYEGKNDPTYFSESLLRHYYKHKDFYLLLYNQGLSNMILEALRVSVKLEEANNNLERYAKSMIAGMIWGWVDDCLVDSLLVRGDSEHGVGKLNGGNFLAAHINDIKFSHCVFLLYALTLSLTQTTEPFGPGMAPLMAIRLFSASTLTTLRF